MILDRELRSGRFQKLVRAMDLREDLAVGTLFLFWRDTRAAGVTALAHQNIRDYLRCAITEEEAVISALKYAGYIVPLEHTGQANPMSLMSIPDNQAFIDAAERKRVAARNAGQASARARVKRDQALARAQNREEREAEKVPLPKAEVPPPPLKARKLAITPPHQPAHQEAVTSRTPLQEACRATWHAYETAYRQQTGVAPINNAKGNALIKQFCMRLPQTDAPAVMAFYVGHADSFYRQKVWPLELALKDAEGLHTQWRRGQAVTREQVMDYGRHEKVNQALARGRLF